MQDPKRASALSLPGTNRSVANQKFVSPVRQPQNAPTYGSWQHEIHSPDAEIMYNQLANPNIGIIITFAMQNSHRKNNFFFFFAFKRN